MRGNNQTRSRSGENLDSTGFLAGTDLFEGRNSGENGESVDQEFPLNPKNAMNPGRCRSTGEYDYSEWRFFRECFCSESSD